MLDDIPMSIKMNHKTFPEIKDLSEGKKINEKGILELLDFIDHRYDCSDFRMVSIVRSLYDYPSLISEETLDKMKQTVLGFKYRMEDPGIDGMCFWSENHQLIFSTVEYLSGHLFIDEIFTNTHKMGLFHKERAYEHLIYWFKTRFDLGFVEFHSNTYFEEDIAPLSLLIDLAPDENIKIMATILMDLLMLDLALHHFKGFFSAASGRCYERQKINPHEQDILDIMKKAFDLGPVKDYDYTRLSTDFILNRSYQVPHVIKHIAYHKEPMIVKDSHGLYLHEVSSYFHGSKDYLTTGNYFWSMESFSNVESIELTMNMFHDWKLKHNTFLKNLDAFDKRILKKLKLMKPLIKILNPTTQGVAIQKGNIYTYKHEDYMLSTAQMHVPKTFGDQQHIGGAVLNHDTSVFITHPAQAFFEDNSRNFSPSYWVGNGIMPFAFQHEKHALYVYDLRVRKGMFEKKRALFTHLYLKQDDFEELYESDYFIVGKVKDALIGIRSLQKMVKHNDHEYRQYGRQTAWSISVDSMKHISLNRFIDFIMEQSISKKGSMVCYHDIKIDTRKKLTYVNNDLVTTEYQRFETPFITAPKQSDVFDIVYENDKLTLNLKELIRCESILK